MIVMINQFEKIGFAPNRLVYEVGGGQARQENAAPVGLYGAFDALRKANGVNDNDKAPISEVRTAGPKAMAVIDDDERMPTTRGDRNLRREPIKL